MSIFNQFYQETLQNISPGESATHNAETATRTKKGTAPSNALTNSSGLSLSVFTCAQISGPVKAVNA
ncbi:hypothetical protein THRCLA_21890 [Thraustotheca clavata]|uniref:Uncharacterized protein n=1 Tax=Thraustotheca clavata TaxID=74557 RepID=A0A1V9ZK84_9STRA|nr:hypothetical protein THRCLA_21890 [Thraustotheca clavata]